MMSSKLNPNVNKDCVNCGSKVKNNYYVLSDSTFIHKPCLEILRYSLVDIGLDQDMKQFYNFILSKVVNCTKCNNPLDLLHTNYITSPLCSACKPVNIFEVKEQTQYCQLCDQQITKQNKLKKVPLIQGIVMCTPCYKLQTGQQDKEPQQKPDYREIKSLFEQKSSYKPKKNLAKLDDFKHLQEIEEKNIKVQLNEKQDLQHLHHQNLVICEMCYKQQDKSNFVQIQGNVGVCKNCFGFADIFGFQPPIKKENKKNQLEPGYGNQEEFGLQDLFGQKEVDIQPPKLIPLQKVGNKKVQKKEQKVEIIKPIKEETHKYSLKECKICFNAQSQMINAKCRHLMMCEPCYKRLLTRQNKKSELCCPVCQTVGKYYKYLQPIYI